MLAQIFAEQALANPSALLAQGLPQLVGLPRLTTLCPRTRT